MPRQGPSNFEIDAFNARSQAQLDWKTTASLHHYSDRMIASLIERVRPRFIARDASRQHNVRQMTQPLLQKEAATGAPKCRQGARVAGIEAAFMGTLGRDAEHKTAKSGKPYLRFSCRVGDGDGAQWISVMAFDERATEQPDRFVKGARVYVEGSIRRGQWTAQDGALRHGLSCMSWHCRLSEIGRNKPKRERKAKITSVDVATPSHAAKPSNFYSDEIGF